MDVLPLISPTPLPVMGLYDAPMWQSIGDQCMALQRCNDCGHMQYPPGPSCPACLSPALTWTPVSGKGRILSWVVFHKTYLPAYPSPYNVVAIRLMEGPVLISNLEGPQPTGSWIGASVTLVYKKMADGFMLPKFILIPETEHAM